MGTLTQIYHLQTISYTILPANMQPYSHTYYSLFILISGNGTLKTNHETIHLMKEKCVIIPPNCHVEIHTAN
ncbi:MAG: AraC family transcriptional regulator, partial [Lysinibacillus fusiformis]|nr:AraC family transcriptional regulator [Lysinibacillus fusiformis]